MIGPGDKVVCLISDWEDYFGTFQVPVKGGIYTVRDIFINSRGDVGLYLEEIRNKKFSFTNGYNEPAFSAKFFRKLDIEQFRDMARNADTLPVKNMETV